MAFNLKNIKFTRSRQLFLLLGLLVVVAIVWASLQFAGKNRLVQKLNIQIQPDSGVYIVSQAQVGEIISRTLGNPLGKPVSGLNLRLLERALRKTMGVKTAQVYAGFNGELQVKVEQRIPILRVSNLAGQTFMIDSFGMKMFQLSGAAPDLLPANGNISEMYQDSSRVHTPIMQELLKVAKFISGDPVWNAQFEQCYVDNYMDIILVPRVGRHSIVIGNAENIEEKMRNLRLFYTKALNSMGWDKYRIINLKYKNQVLGSPAVLNKEQ